MKYFTKYLPVEGEIKEKDFFIFNGKVAQVIHMKEKYIQISYNGQSGVRANFDDCKKVKLFLCSRNIQKGDEITYLNGLKRTIVTEEFADAISLAYERNSFGGDGHYKIIGEISRHAAWVKEGDEFEHKEVALTSLWQDWDSHTPLSGEAIVFVKGPCKHFH